MGWADGGGCRVCMCRYSSQRRLAQRIYTTLEEWAEELQRVFLNAIAFNCVPPDKLTRKLFDNARKCLDKFQELYHTRCVRRTRTAFAVRDTARPDACV